MLIFVCCIALDLETQRGTIPARSKHLLRATVRPARRVYYQWSLSYKLIASHGR